MAHLPYPPTSAGRPAVSEYLESLKSEFESTAHEAHMYKLQKDDLERKLNAQLNEFASFQKTLFDLEKNHQHIKAQYEEEILMLRRQLANSLTSSAPRTSSSSPSMSVNSYLPIPQIAPTKPPAPSPTTKPPNHPPPTIKPPTPPPTTKPPTPTPTTKPPTPPPATNPPVPVEKMEVDKDWLVGYNPGVQTSLTIDLLHTLNLSSVVCCVKFSADGNHLATGCNTGVQIYDVETGRKEHNFVEAMWEGDLFVRDVCFSPDGRYLATGAEDMTVKVWDIPQKRLLHTFTGHELDIYSIDYSSNGRYIVSGSGDKKVKIWDLEKRRCVFTLGNEEVGPKDGVTSVAISPDGRLVAAGSLDRVVRLWDAHTGYFLERYEGHRDSVYSVAFSPDGKSLVSGSFDKSLKLWDLSCSRARTRCRSTLTGHKDFVLSVAFSPDGKWLASGSKDRSVQFWDPRASFNPHMMLQGHKNSVISVAISPAGGVCATGSGDHRARVWKYEA